jgi:hypothetical protein
MLFRNIVHLLVPVCAATCMPARAQLRRESPRGTWAPFTSLYKSGTANVLHIRRTRLSLAPVDMRIKIHHGAGVYVQDSCTTISRASKRISSFVKSSRATVTVKKKVPPPRLAVNSMEMSRVSPGAKGATAPAPALLVSHPNISRPRGSRSRKPT